MESKRIPDLWQDVYRTRYEGIDVYLKLQIAPTAEAVVISFKRK